jgi:hypothetical protein
MQKSSIPRGEYLIQCKHNNYYLDFDTNRAKQYCKKHPRILMNQDGKSRTLVWKIEPVQVDGNEYFMLLTTTEKEMSLDGNSKRYIPQYSRNFKSPYLWEPRETHPNHHWTLSIVIDNTMIVSIINRDNGFCLDGSIEKAKHKDPIHRSPYFAKYNAENTPLCQCWELIPFKRSIPREPSTITHTTVSCTSRTLSIESDSDDDEITIEDAQEYIQELYDIIQQTQSTMNRYDNVKHYVKKIQSEMKLLDRFVQEQNKSKDAMTQKIISQYSEMRQKCMEYMNSVSHSKKKKQINHTSSQVTHTSNTTDQQQIQLKELKLDSASKSTIKVEKAIALETREELEQITTDLLELNQLVVEVDQLIQIQDVSLVQVETNVTKANENIKKGNEDITTAKELSNPTIIPSKITLLRSYLGI